MKPLSSSRNSGPQVEIKFKKKERVTDYNIMALL